MKQNGIQVCVDETQEEEEEKRPRNNLKSLYRNSHINTMFDATIAFKIEFVH